MTAPSSRCLKPEVIAAFVAGSLSGAELKMTADHLRECEDCREVAAEAAWVDREGTQAAVEPQPRRMWPWWLGVAAAALTVFLALWSSHRDETNDAIEPLIAAMPHEARYLEPRVTGGFPWAPLHSVRRDGSEPLDANQMRVVGAAGEVLQRTAGKESVAAKHASALAHLLAGRPKEAADLLTPVAASASSAQIWSDLAASRYAAAVSDDDPPQLADALAAADTALRRNPKLAEALFNRALIIEGLGLRDQARAAWERYLAIDGESEWAAEARQHLRAITPVTEFSEELRRRYATLSRDPAAAHAFVRQYPQDARVWGETEILARWAEAIQRGDSVAAAEHLRVAHAFADELNRHGEELLLGAVTAVERADDGARSDLAEAHIHYRSAQLTYRASQPAAAQKLFAAAAAGFGRGNSPIALHARYFVANTLYDQGHTADALALLEQLAATAPTGFAAHRAQVRWQLGLAYAALGRWGDAIGVLNESVTLFARLGETRYANAVRDILAEVYDRIGDRRAAWAHRIVTLHELGRTGGPRLRVALDAAARAAAVNHDWLVSISMLGLLAETVRERDDLLYVETLLMRARLKERVGESSAAASDLMHATRAIHHLGDAALRERADADRLAVEALLAPSPVEALPLLSRALDFHRVKGRRMHLPDLLLQRGRAHAALGHEDAAAEDFEAGIREVELQRTSVTTPDRMWGNLAVGEELFEEAITSAIARGDTADAFVYSERSRTQVDSAATFTVAAAVPMRVAETVVVEYVSLPTRLVIFVVEAGSVRSVLSSVTRGALAVEVELLARSAMADDVAAFRRAAASMYQRLLAPIATEIAAAKTVIFVPDATLSAVPFSALLDPKGSYFVEQHAVVIAPSSSLFARLAQRSHVATRGMQLLLIAGPAARKGEAGRLSAAAREAEAIAAEYGPTADLVPNRADQTVFEQHAAAADVIHFVGHAAMPDGASEAALITSVDDGAAGRLGAREIAAMKLTRTRIVVLAACGTARGHQRPGETSISVARAFLSAGVSSVVATLWPIEDDPAAEFFPAFHRHLARGRSPADALRATQLEWIHSDAPPGMWAAVQIIGS